MSGDSNDQIRSIAEVLVGVYSDAALQKILTDHTADYSGHCRGCRFPTGAPPLWPCRLWAIGKETERLRRRRRLPRPA